MKKKTCDMFLCIIVSTVLLISCSYNADKNYNQEVFSSAELLRLKLLKIPTPENELEKAFFGFDSKLINNNGVNMKIKVVSETAMSLFVKKLHILGFSVKSISDSGGLGEKYVYAVVSRDYPVALAKLRTLDEIIFAEPDYISVCPKPITSEIKLASLEDGELINDPQGDKLEYALAITDALKAYREIGIGTNKVWAGILDTGINAPHEDFKYSDGSSVIKLVKSPFSPNDWTTTLISFKEVPPGMNSDKEIGHGSHCAGSIAAAGNNGKGIAGVAWKNVNLIVYKVFDAQGQSFNVPGAIRDFTDTVRQYISQEEQAVIPLNMSLGSPVADRSELAAINYALSKGVLPIVAMSNDGHRLACYPAAFNGVLSVGATNSKDKKAEFSTSGSWINICAPGSRIISVGKEHSRDYAIMSGTSMATPFVTGMVTYLLSINPKLTVEQVIALLENTADKVDGLNTHPVGKYENGFSEWYGHGRVNVYKAAKAVKMNNLPSTKSMSTSSVVTIKVTRDDKPVYIYNEKDMCISLLSPRDGEANISNLRIGHYKAVQSGIEKHFEITGSTDVYISLK